MRIGLVPPDGYFDEFEGWPADRAIRRVIDACLLAERLGFDSVWFGEHLLAKWSRRAPIFDCVILATAVAAAVPRLAIGFTVINSTFHNPVQTAKAAATIDALSGGRLILGLGAGFRESEAKAAGIAYPAVSTRLAILGEHLEIISRLTRSGEPPTSYQGEHAHMEDLSGTPHGVQEPGIPLLIGGHGPNVTFCLAARYCAEINVDEAPDAMPEAMRILRDRCLEVERDPRTLAVSSGTSPSWPYRGLKVTGNQRMMRQEDLPAVMSADFAAIGTRVEELSRWRELGIDRLSCGAPGLADTDETLYELAEDLAQAGIVLDRDQPGATRAATGSWVDALG